MPQAPPVPPFETAHVVSWAAIAAASLPLVLFLPQYRHELSGAFTLACCVLGYLGGTKLPAAVRSVFHPIIVCSAVGYAGVAAKAAFFSETVDVALRTFLSKVRCCCCVPRL